MITHLGFGGSLESEIGFAAGILSASLWPFVQKIGRLGLPLHLSGCALYGTPYSLVLKVKR
jgi:hypothetical protein